MFYKFLPPVKIIWALLLLALILLIVFMINPFKKTFKNLVNNTKSVGFSITQKTGSKIYIHKIVGLGDEVRDEREYGQVCQIPKKYLDKRYSGILKFDPLPSDYKEENFGIYRYSDSIGGQYSCLFRGTYVKDFPDLKLLVDKNFRMAEFDNISFDYPNIESFELKQNYNSKNKSGEIIYYSQKNSTDQQVSNLAQDLHHPMLIIQKINAQTSTYSVDKINTNPNSIKYKIWNENDVPDVENYSNDPYRNLDTTIEFDVSDKEVYLVSTVNFVHNGISEQPILDIISNSFKLK